MRALAVVSLTLVTGVALIWYIVTSVHERKIGTRSLADQPVRFVLEVAAYVALTIVIFWGGALGVSEVEAVLWALWPGALGPALAIVLGRRHWGEPAPRELLSEFAEKLRCAAVDDAKQLIEARTRRGSTRRLLMAALGAPPPEPGVAADYRSAATASWAPLEEALARALVVERRRGFYRLIPAATAPVACALLWSAPPEAERAAAFVVALLELALAALGVVLDRKRARRAAGDVASLCAALRA